MTTTTIRIGPYHPYLLEPSVLDLDVQDERIARLTVTLGYVHRGVEQLMTQKTYRQNVLLAERICGICSNVHTLAFCQAAERIMEIEVPPRAAFLRTLMVELERLHSHFLCLGLLAHAVHAAESFSRLMGEREALIALLERVSGNRIHYSTNTIGGVRRDLPPELAAEVLAVLPRLERLADFAIEALKEGGPLGKTVAGLGVVGEPEVLALGGVGPTLRATGAASDVRREEPYAAYEQVQFDVITETRGDVRARYLVRAREALESVKIIRQLLERLPEGPILGTLKEPRLRERREVIARVEAPRHQHPGARQGPDPDLCQRTSPDPRAQGRDRGPRPRHHREHRSLPVLHRPLRPLSPAKEIPSGTCPEGIVVFLRNVQTTS